MPRNPSEVAAALRLMKKDPTPRNILRAAQFAARYADDEGVGKAYAAAIELYERLKDAESRNLNELHAAYDFNDTQGVKAATKIQKHLHIQSSEAFLVLDEVDRLRWPQAEENPYVRYKPEVGKPVKKDSKWIDLSSSRDVSNTYWPSGWVDYSGEKPVVFTQEPEISEREWKRPGARIVTYLLHPDKWAPVGHPIQSARGFIPNVSIAPTQPSGYALRITYNVPVKLSSRPHLAKNPRAWFESRGAATAFNEIGRVRIVGAGKGGRVVPVYQEIVVHDPQAILSPGGIRLV